MKIDEQAIMRFLRGESTVAEAQQVADYLKTHQEIMDTLFDEDEWLHTVNEQVYPPLPYQEERLLETIQQKLYGNRKNGVIKYLRPWVKWSVAACIAIGIILTVIFYGRPQTAIPVATTNVQVNDSITWRNNTGKPETKYLSDGSLVCLEPGSALHYRKDFEPGRRLLRLEGVAKFTVAKNASRPFTVMTGDVSTTAIGTIFTISNTGEQQHLTVKLWEGKVVVKNSKQPDNIIHLLPGERCAFDGIVLYKMNTLPPVLRPQNTFLAKKPEQQQADSTSQSDGSHILFKNASLPTVFNALDQLYDIKIIYKNVPDTVLSKVLYSGSFDKTKMKAERVVNAVTLVNDLNWIRVDSTTYLISPQ